MHWLMVAFVAVLFVALTPGVLVTLPPRSSKLVVAATHGILFALVYHFTHHAVWTYFYGSAREGVANRCPAGQTYDKAAKKCAPKTA